MKSKLMRLTKKQLIDKHYYAIASKATLLKPDKLPVPKDKFKETFGVDWDESLKAGVVFNAKDACTELDIDANEIDKMWGVCKKEKKLVKFGGGFYCAELEKDGKKIYAFNGFFMSMRSKFVAEGASIYYYLVEWESDELSWADFRGKVLGPTDPADAPEDSLRGAILKNWQDLDLKEVPNTGDNAVHASASPFEALAERNNWLGFRADRDYFGKLLIQKAGVSRALIKDWSLDPQVTYGVAPMTITKSLFDAVEDMDSDHCLANLSMMAMFQGGPKEEKPSGKLEKEVQQLKDQLATLEHIAGAVAAIQAYKPLVQEESKTENGAKGERKGKGKGKSKKK